jgi:predicted nucleic acid-binding protein
MGDLGMASALSRTARRRIHDARISLTLRHHGVNERATTNVKDFEGFGFARVWNLIGEG